MAHSPAPEPTLIDVEADAEKSDQMRNILHSQHIFIPERYHVKMIHNGLMARFVQFIKQESKLNEETKRLLTKHHISIPREFYPKLLQTDLFQDLLNVAHDVDREKEIERATFIKENFYPKRKRRRSSSLVTNTGEDQHEIQANFSDVSD